MAKIFKSTIADLFKPPPVGPIHWFAWFPKDPKRKKECEYPKEDERLLEPKKNPYRGGYYKLPYPFFQSFQYNAPSKFSLEPTPCKEI